VSRRGGEIRQTSRRLRHACHERKDEIIFMTRQTLGIAFLSTGTGITKKFRLISNVPTTLAVLALFL
jgi:hypothetical protein